jgi:hypothetical protein
MSSGKISQDRAELQRLLKRLAGAAERHGIDVFRPNDSRYHTVIASAYPEHREAFRIYVAGAQSSGLAGRAVLAAVRVLTGEDSSAEPAGTQENTDGQGNK